MKKIVLYALMAAILCGCSFSKGVKKNLATGLYYDYNGFKIDNVVACNIYDEPLSNNKLPERSVLVLYFENVSGYTVENGMVSIGCRLLVSDPDGNIMLQSDDLYESTGEITEKDANRTQIKITLAKPIVAGKTYSVKARLFDKKNEKNEVNVEMNVDVTNYAVNVKNKPSGLNFDDFWFGTTQNELAENKVKYGSEVAIMPKLISGFTVVENLVYPAYFVKATNAQGEVVYEDSAEANKGELAEAVQKGLPIVIKYDEKFKAGETYNINVLLYDLIKPEAEVSINMDVVVIE